MTVFKGYIDQFGQNHQLVSSLINQNIENENSESISLEETGIDENAGVGVCSDNSNDDDDDDVKVITINLIKMVEEKTNTLF